MSIISYAQNFEDVMLWRALKHINKGFYIDVGAQDPVIDSVSLAFYEQGWRGVNIEPTPQYSTKLRNARPDEVVEQVAIGGREGHLTFYEFPNTGLSTAIPEIAKRHQAAGFASVESQVSVVSLDSILDKYGDKDIHWLKIDVEGLEKSVLDSWVESIVRPWILVIESTKPLTQDESYSEWESIVLGKGYRFAYFDGLNRFYIHENHLELMSAFEVPPNIFDEFKLSGSASQPFYQIFAVRSQRAESRARKAEAIAHDAEMRALSAEARVQEAEAKMHEAVSAEERALAQLQSLQNSFLCRLGERWNSLVKRFF